MAIKITIPGANYSSYGNPAVIDYVQGFNGQNLAALYMFDTETVDAAFVGPAIDVTPNGNDATLLTGSTAIRQAEGVSNVASGASAANQGFGVLTPVAISPKFTVFGVSRNLYPSAAISQFSMPWLSSGNTTVPASPTVGSASFGTANGTGADGRLHISQQTNVSSDYAEIGVFNANSAGTQWTGGTTRPSVVDVGEDKDAWITWALAFDSVAGTVLMRTLGGQVSLTGVATPAAAWASGQAGRGGKHMFGGMTYSDDSDGSKYAIGIAGIYDGVAKSSAELDAIIVNLKTLMALRSVTAL